MNLFLGLITLTAAVHYSHQSLSYTRNRYGGATNTNQQQLQQPQSLLSNLYASFTRQIQEVPQNLAPLPVRNNRYRYRSYRRPQKPKIQPVDSLINPVGGPSSLLIPDHHGNVGLPSPVVDVHNPPPSVPVHPIHPVHPEHPVHPVDPAAVPPQPVETDPRCAEMCQNNIAPERCHCAEHLCERQQCHGVEVCRLFRDRGMVEALCLPVDAVTGQAAGQNHGTHHTTDHHNAPTVSHGTGVVDHIEPIGATNAVVGGHSPHGGPAETDPQCIEMCQTNIAPEQCHCAEHLCDTQQCHDAGASCRLVRERGMVEALCLPVDAVTGQAAGQNHGIHHTTGCGLSMDEGRPCGGASTTEYYFDVMTQTCTTFVYNGCGGNENRFKTLHECEETCSQRHISPGIIDHHNAPTISHGTGVADHIEPIGTPITDPLPKPEPSGVPAETDPQCVEMCQTNIAPEKCHCAEHLCDRHQCPDVGVSCRLIRERGMVEALCLPVDAVTGQAAGQNHGTHHTTGCGLPMNEGTRCGGPSSNAYYFDVMTQECTTFVYNGCGGNDNRFKTLHECEETCSQRHISPGIIYHHNTPTVSHGTGVADHIEPIGTPITDPLPKPEPTVLVGGGGSPPGVPAETDPQCVEMCQTNIAPEKCHCAEHLCDRHQCPDVGVSCRLIRERGMVEALCLPVDAVTGQATGQNHGTHHTTGCGLPMNDGTPCGGPSTNAYYFDVMTQACTTFVYNGCGGNDNRFKTLHECEETCSQRHISPGIIDHHNAPTVSHGTGVVDHIEPISVGVVKSPPPLPASNTDASDCTLLCTKSLVPERCHCSDYLCDHKTCEGNNVCKLMRSGGLAEAMCIQPTSVPDSTSRRPSNACGLPKDIGSCLRRRRRRRNRESIRYYFDAETQSCETFTFSGCRGNANRFMTRRRCEKFCLETRITDGVHRENPSEAGLADTSGTYAINKRNGRGPRLTRILGSGGRGHMTLITTGSNIFQSPVGRTRQRVSGLQGLFQPLIRSLFGYQRRERPNYRRATKTGTKDRSHSNP